MISEVKVEWIRLELTIDRSLFQARAEGTEYSYALSNSGEGCSPSVSARTYEARGGVNHAANSGK